MPSVGQKCNRGEEAAAGEGKGSERVRSDGRNHAQRGGRASGSENSPRAAVCNAGSMDFRFFSKTFYLSARRVVPPYPGRDSRCTSGVRKVLMVAGPSPPAVST